MEGVFERGSRWEVARLHYVSPSAWEQVAAFQVLLVLTCTLTRSLAAMGHKDKDEKAKAKAKKVWLRMTNKGCCACTDDVPHA